MKLILKMGQLDQDLGAGENQCLEAQAKAKREAKGPRSCH